MAISKKGSGAPEGGAVKKTEARKAPAKEAAAKKKTATKKAAPTRSPDLRKDLRDFASARPEGWNHEDWQSFLEHLRTRGHDTSNADAIGLSLERERLAMALERVDGVGPQRVRALADRFVTLWSFRNADVEEIAATANIRRDLAERIKEEV
jgi:hypothetical protein